MAKLAKKFPAANNMARGGTTVDDESAVVVATGGGVGEGVYRSLDPLDPRRVSMDIFELYCQEMLVTDFVGRRAYLINKMRYMIRRLIGFQYPYGRLYNRTCIANIVGRVCARHPYEIPDEIEIWDEQLDDCLVDLTPVKWQSILDQFQKLRDGMLRNDAALVVLPSELGDDDELVDEGPLPEEDDGVNEAHESHADFNSTYDEMVARVKFHLCLSHLQPMLHTAMRKKSSIVGGSESVVIPHDNIVAFDSAIDEQFGDAGDRKYRRILKDLLRTTRYQGLNLKSFADIEKIFSTHSRIFDLELFQGNFLDLIRRWTQLVLPFPALSRLKYGTARHGDKGARKPMAGVVDKENVNMGGDVGRKTPSSFATTTMDRRQQPNMRRNPRENENPSPVVSEILFEEEVEDEIQSSSSEEDTDRYTDDVRQNLNRKVKELMKNVKDPLDDCVATAQSARADQHQHLAQTQSDYDSSSDEGDHDGGAGPVLKLPPLCHKRKTAYQIKFNDSDDSEGEGNGALSEVPARYEHAKSYQTSFPEIHVKYHPRKMRKNFTAEEDGAIREGVKRFGAGRWAHIKASYAMILKDRDAVALKDRWRTINK